MLGSVRVAIAVGCVCIPLQARADGAAERSAPAQAASPGSAPFHAVAPAPPSNAPSASSADTATALVVVGALTSLVAPGVVTGGYFAATASKTTCLLSSGCSTTYASPAAGIFVMGIGGAILVGGVSMMVVGGLALGADADASPSAARVDFAVGLRGGSATLRF